MSKRKSAVISTDEVIPEINKPSDPNTTKKILNILLCFDLYIKMMGKMRRAMTFECTNEFYDILTNKGELVDIIELFKENPKAKSIAITLETYLEDMANNQHTGYINDTIEFHIVPYLKELLHTLICSTEKKILTVCFIKIIENNMELINRLIQTHNHEGEIANVEFLSNLIQIYEHGWTSSFTTEFSFTNGYIIAVSNRLHALYIHIKHETVS